MKKLIGSAAMIAASLLWGVAFSAQSSGMRYLPPAFFTEVRSLIAVAALALVVVIFDLARKKPVSFWGSADTTQARRKLLQGAWWCGLVIGCASTCQQAGLQYVSAGKSGFLTALYIIFVPILGIFFRRKTSAWLLAAVFLALLGSYFLCGGVSSIGKGEYFVIACAGWFALHILAVDHYVAHCDPIRLSCGQFFAAAVVTAAISAVSGETWSVSGIRGALPYLLFCAIASSTVAFTLQNVAQKYLHPVAAALLMSLESVFAVLGGWLFLGEVLSGREVLGCAVIFLAVIISQVSAYRTGRA